MTGHILAPTPADWDAPMGVIHRRCLRRMHRHDRRQARRSTSHAG